MSIRAMPSNETIKQSIGQVGRVEQRSLLIFFRLLAATFDSLLGLVGEGPMNWVAPEIFGEPIEAAQVSRHQGHPPRRSDGREHRLHGLVSK